MAVLGSYLAACVDHRDVLGPGERGLLPILAASMLQAGQAFNFVEGIFRASRHLSDLIENVTADTLALKTSIDIQDPAGELQDDPGHNRNRSHRRRTRLLAQRR